MSATRLAAGVLRSSSHSRGLTAPAHCLRPRTDTIACTYRRSSTLPSAFRSPLSSPPLRCHSTLPVLEHHVPRQYPFPLVLTTELLMEEDLDLQHLSPHNLPPYKSTLTVNLQDLPLTAGEKRIFRHLVGRRMFSDSFKGHPIPAWLHRKKEAWSTRGKASVNEVKFVSRHLPSAEANENRVFQLLDECVRQSKALAAEMEGDGEWAEMGEDEFLSLQAKKRMQSALWEERQKKRGQSTSTEAVQRPTAASQLTGDSADSEGQAREKVAVPRAQQTGE